jgi:hypothetical protein
MSTALETPRLNVGMDIVIAKENDIIFYDDNTSDEEIKDAIKYCLAQIGRKVPITGSFDTVYKITQAVLGTSLYLAVDYLEITSTKRWQEMETRRLNSEAEKNRTDREAFETELSKQVNNLMKAGASAEVLERFQQVSLERFDEENL